eukprot:232983-Pelagomonas_calceolata.AAC.1
MQDISGVYGDCIHKNLGVKNGPGVELWAMFGWSEARRVIWGPPKFIHQFFVNMILYGKMMFGWVRLEKENRERACPPISGTCPPLST